ncbi:uncharacterized protein [Palaemon carinicauda]|uniref:uncharacterized protein n=1 Tax=Palaemon carinicauda TaxID=392227 RepID=UPI0035B62A4A
MLHKFTLSEPLAKMSVNYESPRFSHLAAPVCHSLAMMSPRNVPVFQAALSKPGSIACTSRIALFMALLIGILAPTAGSPIDVEMLNIQPNEGVTPTTLLPLSHSRNRRSTAEGSSSSLRSRYVSTHGFELRLSSGLNYFVRIENGSIVLGLGQHGNNAREYIFQVASLASGDFVVIESNQGGHFLSVQADGTVAIQTDETSDVTSASTTDNRFFRIFKQNEGDRYYVMQNVRSGRYLHVNNGSLSTVSEDEMNEQSSAVQFEIFDCDVTSG